ncbi:MAG: hypothetical protein ACRD2I_07475, partial [Vicinamibacterales bacterium]
MDKREHARIYRKERFRRIEWSPDVRRDLVIATASGVVAWIMAHGQNTLENVGIPITGAVIGVLGYELCRFIHQFVWGVPRDINLIAVERIAFVENERDLLKADVERLNGVSESRQKIGAGLIAFHSAGVKLSRDIVESDDVTTFQEWAERVLCYRLEVVEFIKQE